MTPKQLERKAKAAFGERWAPPLAEAIKVAEGTVYRWHRGDRRISDSHALLITIVCHPRLGPLVADIDPLYE